MILITLIFGVGTAEASSTRTLDSLQIGDRVVDKSWEWEFRTGDDYGFVEGNVTRPVVWIVVAKDHYGSGSGVTLLSEELIGRHAFDNSTDRGHEWYGSNHWDNSGTTDATRGLRPWLNSTGIHSGAGFYQAFAENFRSSIITITLPNREGSEGVFYTTQDKVFIPSSTELGDVAHTLTYETGTAYPYFLGAGNEKRIASLSGTDRPYLTRSPQKWFYQVDPGSVAAISTWGANASAWCVSDNSGVRPAVNLSSQTPVSLVPDENGVYELFGLLPLLHGRVVADGGKVSFGELLWLPLWLGDVPLPFMPIIATIEGEDYQGVTDAEGRYQIIVGEELAEVVENISEDEPLEITEPGMVQYDIDLVDLIYNADTTAVVCSTPAVVAGDPLLEYFHFTPVYFHTHEALEFALKHLKMGEELAGLTINQYYWTRSTSVTAPYVPL